MRGVRPLGCSEHLTLRRGREGRLGRRRTGGTSAVEGCSAWEELRCDGTVRPGGSPDENGETTTVALVLNGVTMEVGTVAAVRRVKDGIKAARLVMRHAEHTLLVGDKASAFALSMGLPGPSNLSTSESIDKWKKWKANSCQPNFWKSVSPLDRCRPYHPKDMENTCVEANLMSAIELSSSHVGPHNHDTMARTVIDKTGHIAVDTSMNGAAF